jgi:hypothetical protein
MKNIQPLLLPAAILLLAFTQAPQWKRNYYFIECVSATHKNRTEREMYISLPDTVNYCSGGQGYVVR